MKQLLLTLLITFTFSLNAQYAVMYAVDLNEGAEEDYLKHKHLHQKAREESSKSEEVTMIREEVGTQLAVLSEL